MTDAERAAAARRRRIARTLSARMAAAAMHQERIRATARGYSAAEVTRRAQREYDLVFGQSMLGWLALSDAGLANVAAHFGIDPAKAN